MVNFWVDFEIFYFEFYFIYIYIDIYGYIVIFLGIFVVGVNFVVKKREKVLGLFLVIWVGDGLLFFGEGLDNY